MQNKLILADCDGVLLDWVTPFYAFVESKGYKQIITTSYSIAVNFNISKELETDLINEFNASIRFTRLKPYKNAEQVIKKLHNEHGVKIHVITSVGEQAYEKRLKNLHDVFGDSVFDNLHCLHPEESKHHKLEEYKDSGLLWVEDHVPNFYLGLNLGLNAKLMLQEYNMTDIDQHKYFDNLITSWTDIAKLYEAESVL